MDDNGRDLKEALEWLEDTSYYYIGDCLKHHKDLHWASITIVKRLYDAGAKHVYVNIQEMYFTGIAQIVIVDIPPIDITMANVKRIIEDMYTFGVSYSQIISNSQYEIVVTWTPRDEDSFSAPRYDLGYRFI